MKKNILIILLGLILSLSIDAQDEFKISLNCERAKDYKIELTGSNGQLLYLAEAKNVSSSTLTYPRQSNMNAGIYLLRITDKTTNITEIRKLVFE